MSAADLLHEFETLSHEEKEIFARAIWRYLPPLDSGELTDDEISHAGDALAAMLSDEEEHAASPR